MSQKQHVKHTLYSQAKTPSPTASIITVLPRTTGAIKEGPAWPLYGTMDGAGTGARLPFTLAVGAATLALAMDVSFATAAEGLTVGLMEGKAPPTLAQRLGEKRMMAKMGEQGLESMDVLVGWKENQRFGI